MFIYAEGFSERMSQNVSIRSPQCDVILIEHLDATNQSNPMHTQIRNITGAHTDQKYYWSKHRSEILVEHTKGKQRHT